MKSKKKSDQNPKSSNNSNILSPEEIKKERAKIIELSNESVLHGYDMATQILTAAGNKEGLLTLIENRTIIELGLKNGVEQRIEGNIGGTEESSSI